MTIKGERKQHVFSCYQRFLNNQVLLGSACLFSPRRRPGRQAAPGSGRRGCKFGQVLKAALRGSPPQTALQPLPAPYFLGLSGAFQPFPASSSSSSRAAGRGPGPAGSWAPAGGGGGGGRREEEELRSPGPGASPLTALGSDAFPESRRERNKVFFCCCCCCWGFSLVAGPPCPLRPLQPRVPAGGRRAWLRR